MAAKLLKSTKTFLRDASKPRNLNSVVSPLMKQLQDLQSHLSQTSISQSQGLSLVNTVTEYGIKSGHNSYASAEQLVMGLNSLLRAISSTSLSDGNRQQLIKEMNNLFDTVGDPERYNVGLFVSQLKNIQQLSRETGQQGASNVSPTASR